jgi:DNA (cytosine-5)-methyltransferase 1
MYRLSRQIPMNFHHELIVDNFAGGGGASTGIEAALGRPVDIAINHDPAAIAMHTVNHPHTRHLCESVWDVDPRHACGGRPVGLAWFSPDCKHFSKAKGGRPVEKSIRGLAWVAVRWAKTVRPRVIILENVEEFQTWGPLVDDRPCPDRKGETFRNWKNALQRLGYQIEHRELRACDYGAPTTRKRLFVIARCDGAPILWPEPTHGPKGSGLKRYRTAADIIDWSLPCPSIFERKKPLAENTLRRIARGLQRFVIESPDPFIVSYYGTKSPREFRGQSLKEPLRTQTTENRFGLVVPYVERMFTRSADNDIAAPLGAVTSHPKEAVVAAFLAKNYGGNYTGPGVDLGEPLHTVTAQDHHALVAASMIRHFGQSVGSAPAEPVGTITPGGLGKTGLVTSHLLKLRGTCKDGQSVTEPAPTITAGGLHLGEVRAFLLKYYGNEKDGCDLREPLHTIPTRDRFGLVTVQGQPYQIVDIGMRMLEPHELFAAQGFPADYIHNHDGHGNPITKTAQVARCGNAVCPPVAEAIVRANLVEQTTQREAACA